MWLVNHNGFGCHDRKHHHCYVYSLHIYKVEVSGIVAIFFASACKCITQAQWCLLSLALSVSSFPKVSAQPTVAWSYQASILGKFGGAFSTMVHNRFWDLNNHMGSVRAANHDIGLQTICLIILLQQNCWWETISLFRPPFRRRFFHIFM